MRHTLRALVWAGMSALVGCSLWLDFNANQTPCKEEDGTGLFACLSGYTCAPGPGDSKICVSDHSLSVDDPCFNDAQCPEKTLCTEGKCQPVCALANVYRANAGCGGDRFCAPYVSVNAYSDGGSPPPALVSACRATDTCDVGGTCNSPARASGGVCVGISNTSRACLTRCEVEYTANAYSDNCADGFACVPVGPQFQQQTVCVQNTVGAQVAGGACSNVAGQPCPRGSFCSYGTCAKWCEPTANTGSTCDSGQRCCPFILNSNKSMGFCATSCP